MLFFQPSEANQKVGSSRIRLPGAGKISLQVLVACALAMGVATVAEALLRALGSSPDTGSGLRLSFGQDPIAWTVSPSAVGELKRSVGEATPFLAPTIIALIAALLWRLHLNDRNTFGIANTVTLVRCALVAALCAVPISAVASALSPWFEPIQWSETLAWSVLAIATVAGLLDLVDGWVARRLGTATHIGARFDMEVDALLILTLSGILWAAGIAGPWVLIAGVLRYGFIGLSFLDERFTRPLAFSHRRRIVCGVQYVALITALAPIVSPFLAELIVAGAVSLLVWSFACDVSTQLRRQ